MSRTRISLDELKKRFETRSPDEMELNLINQFRPKGTPEYTANEILRIPFLASTNLLFGSLGVWTEKALETMVATYPGKDLMLNHAWDKTETTCGFIYDAELIVVPNPSKEAINRVIADSPNPAIDKEIIKKDGIIQVLCYAAVEASHPVVGEARFRRLADVSTGGVFYGDWICPLCNTSFDDPECPHYPPVGFFLWGEDEEKIAPYYIRDGQHVSVELSFVSEGNCIQAEMLCENLETLVLG